MKHLLKLVMAVTGKAGLVRYILLGALTGFSSFLFLNLVTRVIGILIPGNYTMVSREYVLIFLGVILTFIWARRSLSAMIIYLSLRISWGVRKQIISLVLGSGYQQVVGQRTQVQTAILRDVDVLTNAAMATISLCLSTIMTISCLIYLATISLVLFGITLAVAVAGCCVYYFTSRNNLKAMQKSRSLENNFQRNFNAILYGFKEISMDSRKGKFIYDKRIVPIANESFAYDIKAVLALLSNQVTGQILFYLLITSILLFWSVTLSIRASDVVSYVFTTLYLLGSIEGIMLQYPAFVRAAVSAEHLNALRRKLELLHAKERITSSSTVSSDPFGGDFRQLDICGLIFRYSTGEPPVSIGPADLTLRAGETVFIYGGNGSGKTTFVNAAIGLTTPEAGEIRLNGILLKDHHLDSYKQYFAPVFSDFYLFDELLYDTPADGGKWDFYITLFELSEKVKLQGGRFSTVDLSSAQRKRLALAVSLMEEKPVLVLDEWAADQDPYFRRKFYREIIPLLNARGVTILAVTHDDAYYSAADRLYKMEEGRLHEQKVSLAGKSIVY